MTKAGAFDHNGDDVAAGSLRGHRRRRHDADHSYRPGNDSSNQPSTPTQCAHVIES
jgi:hypothetical protein